VKKKQILENQLRLNERLAELFENEKIKTFNFTSFGNSISTGYSIARTTKPLLLRNESLNDVMKQNDIILKRYHFARAQTNGDEHLYDWLINNSTNEMIELKDHPWFLGCQFHPEFKSRPNSPHPIFKSFIKAAKDNKNNNI